jgi:large conductance mechanosensitive channel
MPPIGLALGNVDFANLFIILKHGAEMAGPYASLADAQTAGAVTLNYGTFINTIISFIIVALAVFMLIRNINKLKRKEEAPPPEPTTKECPHCFSTIPIKATRCPMCTSELKPA